MKELQVCLSRCRREEIFAIPMFLISSAHEYICNPERTLPQVAMCPFLELVKHGCCSPEGKTGVLKTCINGGNEERRYSLLGPSYGSRDTFIYMNLATSTFADRHVILRGKTQGASQVTYVPSRMFIDVPVHVAQSSAKGEQSQRTSRNLSGLGEKQGTKSRLSSHRRSLRTG